MRVRTKMTATILTLALVFTLLPVNVFANTVGNLNVTTDTTGRTLLTVDNDWQYELSKATLGKKSILTSDQTAYVLLCNGALKMYSYKYQKNESTVRTVTIDTGVVDISQDGYEKSNEHHNWLSDQEIRKKLGVNDGNTNNGSNTNNGNNTNNNTSTNKSGVYMSDDSKTVLYNDGKTTYVLSEKHLVSEVATVGDTVYIRYADGSIKSWKTTSEKTLIVLSDVAVGTKGFAKDSSGKVTGYYDSYGKVQSFYSITPSTESNQLYVSVNNKVATVVVVKGNSIITTKTFGKDLMWAYPDSTNTVYCKDEKGDLYIWNYDIQKDSTNPVKIATNVNDAVVFNNKIIGYTLTGSSVVQSTWTLDQVKIAIAMYESNKNNNSNNTNQTTEKYSYAFKVITKNSYKVLYDSKNQKVAKLRLLKGKLSYMGIKISKVKKADFTKSGDVVYVKTNGKYYLLNKSTLATRLVSTKCSHFKHDSNGFATHVIKKNKTQEKIN